MYNNQGIPALRNLIKLNILTIPLIMNRFFQNCLLLIFLFPLTLSYGQDYQTKELNGITLAYRVVGEGEPLVLLHGFTSAGVMWGDIPASYAGEYQVIVPDLRGHGQSTNPSGKFTHRQSALDVFALLDALGIDSFKAMGISTGGMTLLHMATSQPDRVEAMVLIGATSYFPEQAREIMIESNPENIPVEGFEQLGQIHARGAAQAKEIMQQFYDFRNSYDDMNFTPPLLGTITARTLIIHGDRDEFFPVDIPVMEYKAIPESQLWIVPNGGHVPLLNDDTERAFFTHVTKNFLSGEGE